MIVTIGDSHTAGMRHILLDEKEYLKKYKVWPEILAEKMDMGLKNISKGGQPLEMSIQYLIDNLEYIVDNADIVIFEFQHFQNTLLRYEEIEGPISSKALITGPTYAKDSKGIETRGVQMWKQLLEKGIVESEDELHLIHWFWKFQERSTWYDIDKVIGIFKFLKKVHNIDCYIFYWKEPDTIKVIDNDMVVKFKTKKSETIVQNGKAITQIVERDTIFAQEMQPKTIKMETDGRVDDGHFGIEGNYLLAESIYNYIKSTK